MVKDLSTDAESKVRELQPYCRGRDHYMHCDFFFCIIFLERGVMCRVFDMSTTFPFSLNAARGSITLTSVSSQP